MPSVSRPYCLTTPTTPTMVIGFLGSNHRCFPMASLCGQKRCANFWSMMTICGMSAVSCCGEKAARHQRNLHGTEIVHACGSLIDLQLLSWRRSVSLHVDASPSHRSSQRKCRNCAFGDDAWQVGDAGFNFAVETGEDFILAVLRVVGHDLHGQYVVRGETGRHALQADEAADQ